MISVRTVPCEMDLTYFTPKIECSCISEGLLRAKDVSKLLGSDKDGIRIIVRGSLSHPDLISRHLYAEAILTMGKSVWCHSSGASGMGARDAAS